MSRDDSIFLNLIYGISKQTILNSFASKKIVFVCSVYNYSPIIIQLLINSQYFFILITDNFYFFQSHRWIFIFLSREFFIFILTWHYKFIFIIILLINAIFYIVLISDIFDWKWWSHSKANLSNNTMEFTIQKLPINYLKWIKKSSETWRF